MKKYIYKVSGNDADFKLFSGEQFDSYNELINALRDQGFELIESPDYFTRFITAIGIGRYKKAVIECFRPITPVNLDVLPDITIFYRKA